MSVILKLIWFFSLGIVCYDLYLLISPDTASDVKQTIAIWGLINAAMLYYNYDYTWNPEK